MGSTIYHAFRAFVFTLFAVTIVSAEIKLEMVEDEEFPMATIPNGKIQGSSSRTSRSGRTLYSFYDIPYAKPPARFALAEPPENWEGVLDGTKSVNQCPQAYPGLQIDTMMGFDGTEDCLHLNVYVPEEAVKAKKTMPVIVVVHPGMFIFGYGNMLRPTYLQDEDVVFVSFNYRIGALGFLTTNDDLAPPNRGLHDQILALKWVQNNIAHFGGDPTKVTLIGVSAGACMAHMLMLSPLSSGLFSSVILHSGTALSPWAIEKHPVNTTQNFAKELNCSTTSNAEMIECLKKVPAEDLISMQLKRKWVLGFTYRFLPTIEPAGSANPIVPDWPQKLLEEGKFDKHPIIIGGIERDGLIGSATILEDEHLVEEFNSNWNKVAPFALMYDEDAEDHLTPEERDKISGKIRQFYFGDKLVGKETLDNLTHLYSDFWFIRGIEKSASLHAKHGAVVYPYMFSYKGHYSFLHMQGITEHNEPTHGDDALYIFSTGFIPDLKKHPKDEEFSRKFVHLWLSFINTGKPSATFGSAKDWHPLSPDEYPIKWYNIDEDTRYEEYPYEERVKFWEDIIASHFKM